MRVREAGEEDAPGVVEVYVAGSGPASREARIERFGWWGDPAAFSAYLRALREVGGVAFVAEEGGRILGEAEVIPDEGPSLVGPHAFLASLWVHPRARGMGIGRSLVERCEEEAESWGFRSVDTVPIPGAEGYFERRGFMLLDRHLLSVAPARPAPELAGLVRMGPSDYPSRLALISGDFRPGRLSWRLLWGPESAELGLDPPKAFAIRVGSWNFAVLLYRRRRSQANLVLWGEPEASPGQVFDALEIALRLASEAGFESVSSQHWERFDFAFQAAGFEKSDERPWLRRRVRG